MKESMRSTFCLSSGDNGAGQDDADANLHLFGEKLSSLCDASHAEIRVSNPVLNSSGKDTRLLAM